MGYLNQIKKLIHIHSRLRFLNEIIATTIFVILHITLYMSTLNLFWALNEMSRKMFLLKIRYCFLANKSGNCYSENMKEISTWNFLNSNSSLQLFCFHIHINYYMYYRLCFLLKESNVFLEHKLNKLNAL